MAKRQNAIAINAYKDVLIEKFVGFQSISFIEERKQLTYKLNSFIENQKIAGKTLQKFHDMENRRLSSHM